MSYHAAWLEIEKQIVKPKKNYLDGDYPVTEKMARVLAKLWVNREFVYYMISGGRLPNGKYRKVHNDPVIHRMVMRVWVMRTEQTREEANGDVFRIYHISEKGMTALEVYLRNRRLKG